MATAKLRNEYERMCTCACGMRAIRDRVRAAYRYAIARDTGTRALALHIIIYMRIT